MIIVYLKRDNNVTVCCENSHYKKRQQCSIVTSTHTHCHRCWRMNESDYMYPYFFYISATPFCGLFLISSLRPETPLWPCDVNKLYFIRQTPFDNGLHSERHSKSILNIICKSERLQSSNGKNLSYQAVRISLLQVAILALFFSLVRLTVTYVSRTSASSKAQFYEENISL